MNMRHLIGRRIKAIKSRLAELASVDVGEAGSRTSRQVELATERGNLAQELRIAEKRAEKPDREHHSAFHERQRQFAEQEIAERTEHARAFIERLERQGEERQARLWREYLMAIPEDVYRERHLLP